MTDDTVSLSSYKDLSQSSSLGDPSSTASSSTESQVRLELERSQSQVKDLEMARSSLRSEVEKLKSLLDAAAECCPSSDEYDTAASESAEPTLEAMTKAQLVAKVHRLNSVLLTAYKSDEADSAKEAQAQKEIIIARDLAIEKLTKEGEAARVKCAQLEQQHDDLSKASILKTKVTISAKGLRNDAVTQILIIA